MRQVSIRVSYRRDQPGTSSTAATQHGGDPVGRGHRQRLDGGPHALSGQFQPVQVADRGDDVGGVGALFASSPQQIEFDQPCQQKVQDLLLQLVLDDPAAELREDEVEAGVGQVQAQRVHP